MAFQVSLKDSKLFKKIIKCILVLAEDVHMDVNKEGFIIQVMDTSHVSMIDLFFNKNAFTHYHVPENGTYGIRLKDMLKLLECGSDSSPFTIEGQIGGDVMTFKFEDDDGLKVDNFTLKLIDLDIDRLTIPDEINYTCKVNMSAKAYESLCANLLKIGDTLRLRFRENVVQFEVPDAGKITLKHNTGEEEEKKGTSKSKDKDKKDSKEKKIAKIAVKEDKQKKENPFKVILVECQDELATEYSLKYLNMFSKASSICDRVDIFAGSGCALLTEFKMYNEKREDLGRLRYYLASRIEEEAEAAKTAEFSSSSSSSSSTSSHKRPAPAEESEDAPSKKKVKNNEESKEEDATEATEAEE